MSEQTLVASMAALGADTHLLLTESKRPPPRGPLLVLEPGGGPNRNALLGEALARESPLVVRQVNALASVSWFRPQALPFQDASFDCVVLLHLISDGAQPELAEACRVLTPAGLLMLVGLNRLGWVCQVQHRGLPQNARLPGMAPLKVSRALLKLGMRSESFAGAGMLGRKASTGGTVLRVCTRVFEPLADLILICARHRDRASITPLRFSGSTGRIQSAAIRG